MDMMPCLSAVTCSVSFQTHALIALVITQRKRKGERTIETFTYNYTYTHTEIGKTPDKYICRERGVI